MPDENSVQANKQEAAVGASGNHGAGLDGDGPSAADRGKDSDTDPATGSADHATGDDQAQENEDRESPA